MEDKRTKKKKIAHVGKLRSAIKNVVALLGKDRSAPAAADGLPRLIFENVFSKPVLVGRRNGLPTKAALSLYEIHEALQAFDKPLRQMIENINKFRTHAVDDPLLMHMGQVTKGTPYIRYAALLLDQSIDRFTTTLRVQTQIEPRQTGECLRDSPPQACGNCRLSGYQSNMWSP